MNLQSATFIETHVQSLSFSVLESPPEEEDEDVQDYLDETIVDEDVVLSQSLGSGLASQNSAVFDADERELVELLTELGTKPSDKAIAEIDAILSSQRSSGKTKKFLEEDEEETLEMSQVFKDSSDIFDEDEEELANVLVDLGQEDAKKNWNKDPDDKQLAAAAAHAQKGEKEKNPPPSRKKSDDNLWGDETFWEDFDLDEHL